MATEAPKQSVLCFLTDNWLERKIDAPRNRGGTIKFRYSVVAAKHEWTLNEEREGGLPVAQLHAARFADMAPAFKSVCNLEPEACLARIVEALEKLTGKSLASAQEKNATGVRTYPDAPERWVQLGKQLDEFYGVNYAVDDGVKAKLFGADSEDDEE
jgi:hypothetical protein